MTRAVRLNRLLVAQTVGDPTLSAKDAERMGAALVVAERTGEKLGPAAGPESQNRDPGQAKCVDLIAKP